MKTQGRLTRNFPSQSVACPADRLFDASFLSELHVALRRLRLEGPPKFYQPETIRSNNSLHETRDTMHPGFVTDYLMTILEAFRESHLSMTSQKKIRDDVLWDDTLHCWRRQPFWLFCKVAILRTLLLTLPPEEAQEQYKLFMLDVVACLLRRCCEMPVDPQVLSVVHVKLSRRASKFEQRYGKSPGVHIREVSSNARAILEKVWAQHTDMVKEPKKVALHEWADATFLILPGVREKLAQVLLPSGPATKKQTFTPESLPRYSQDQNVLPSLMPASTKFPMTDLVDLETWVEQNLTAWTELAVAKEVIEPCDKLEELIRNYWMRASVNIGPAHSRCHTPCLCVWNFGPRSTKSAYRGYR